MVKVEPHLESLKGTKAFIGDTVNIFVDSGAYASVIIANIITSYGTYAVSFKNNSDIVMLDSIKDFTIVKRANSKRK